MGKSDSRKCLKSKSKPLFIKQCGISTNEQFSLTNAGKKFVKKSMTPDDPAFIIVFEDVVSEVVVEEYNANLIENLHPVPHYLAMQTPK
jgi:hypothetical protein